VGACGNTHIAGNGRREELDGVAATPLAVHFVDKPLLLEVADDLRSAGGWAGRKLGLALVVCARTPVERAATPRASGPVPSQHSARLQPHRSHRHLARPAVVRHSELEEPVVARLAHLRLVVAVGKDLGELLGDGWLFGDG